MDSKSKTPVDESKDFEVGMDLLSFIEKKNKKKRKKPAAEEDDVQDEDTIDVRDGTFI